MGPVPTGGPRLVLIGGPVDRVDVEPVGSSARPASDRYDRRVERADEPRERRQEDGGLSVRGSPARCPYCHDGIEDPAESLVCQACLARHHPACWEGKCASCAGTAALGRVAAPGRGDASAPYEVWKRRLNATYLALLGATFLLMIAGMVMADALGLVSHDPLDPSIPWPVLPAMAANVLVALVIFPLTAVNAWDAYERRRRGGDVPAWAPLLGLGSACSAGLSGYAYHLAWGRHPLPPRPAAPGPRSVEAKKAAGP